MLGLPNIKIVFNSLNTSISFSFNKDKKDIEKKELEEDASDSETFELEKIINDCFVVYHENKNHLKCLLVQNKNKFLFDTRILKQHSFDIFTPPPETI
jgi:hypothetical protein